MNWTFLNVYGLFEKNGNVSYNVQYHIERACYVYNRQNL